MLERESLEERILNIFDIERNTFEDLDGSSKLDFVRQKLNYEEYIVDGPDQLSNQNLFNPALHYFQKELTWTENGWDEIKQSNAAFQFQEYIPTDSAIETLIELSPLIEVGAGNGYLSFVINKNGGDSIATDKYPKSIGENINPDSYPAIHHVEETVPSSILEWTEVKEADHTIITDYPNRNVLVCHPTAVDYWTRELLDLISTNQKLIFIGQWFPGPDACIEFFAELNSENWNLVNKQPIIDYASQNTSMLVFEKENS